MTSPRRNLATISILIAAALWGTTGTARAVSLAAAPPLAVGVMRMLIGGLALTVLTTLRYRRLPGQGLPGAPLAIAASGMAGYNVFFFEAVARAGVATGTVITIGSAPILAGLLGRLFYRERLTPRWALATACGISGVALLSASSGSIQANPLGVALALLASLSYAAFSLGAKQLLHHQRVESVIAAVSALGALMLLPLLARQDISWLTRPAGWGGALYLGVITNALAYTLYASGLNHTTVAHAVTLGLAEPLTAALLGILWLGEPLTLLTALGMIALLAALLLLATEA